MNRLKAYVRSLKGEKLQGKQPLRKRRYIMNIIDKAQIAAEIKAFNNTDFSDCPELTDEQLAQMKPSHYRKMANNNTIKKH